MNVNHCSAILLGLWMIFQQHQALALTVAITNDFGFGQKGPIVKITAISGFASCGKA